MTPMSLLIYFNVDLFDRDGNPLCYNIAELLPVDFYMKLNDPKAR